MINISSSSILTNLLFSNLLLILLYIILRKSKLLLNIGYKLLIGYIFIILLLLFFPFEFANTITISLPKGLSQGVIFLKKTEIHILNYNITFGNIILVIWFVGILIGLRKLGKTYFSLHKLIRTYGNDISNNTPYNLLIKKICDSYNIKNIFHIIEIPLIQTPMIFGIRSPYILIPKSLSLEKRDIYYILHHEALHYIHHDLQFKFISQLLCIFYWWNPVAQLLKKQISIILELRVDRKITDDSNSENTYAYLNCLFKLVQTQLPVESSIAEATPSFCKTDDFLIKQRFFMIINKNDWKANKLKQFLLSIAIITIYLLSILFIFEPSYISPENKKIPLK